MTCSSGGEVLFCDLGTRARVCVQQSSFSDRFPSRLLNKQQRQEVAEMQAGAERRVEGINRKLMSNRPDCAATSFQR